MRRWQGAPWLHLFVGALLLAACAVEAAAPQRVLIVRSFGRDFGPSHSMMPVFRAELVRLAHRPLVFQDVSLDAERGAALDDEAALVEFLLDRYRDARPDLMVSIGAPALQFFQRHRERLFRDQPLLAVSADRPARGAKLGPRDRLVTFRVDFAGIADTALQVLPGTTTLAVVSGNSVLEQFWLNQMRTDLAQLSARVELLWLSNITVSELRRRVAELPPRSAVLYFLFSVDSAGVPQEREQALSFVTTASSAPVFGMFESQLGEGIVGGRMLNYRQVGHAAASTADAMLRQNHAPGRQVEFVDIELVAFDARQLGRWSIPESRLPPASEVRFRPPSLWQEHKLFILGGAAIVLAQAALIAALLVQRMRRRRAEGEAAALTGRLLTAHEDERRRLARELHDDLTQRLARLAIDAARIEHGSGGTESVAAIRRDLVRLSEDVHSLSYRLHPSVLDDLGLVEALKAECSRVERHSALRVDVDARGLPEALPLEASLCLFRVAQEALTNALRHAAASAITVLLSPSGGGLQLAVSDNGRGFDPIRAGGHGSLGLASMRERVRLLHGELNIESTPGRGTTVVAWVPA